MIDTQRDSTTDNIAEIAKRKPRRNIATPFMLLGVSSRNGTFNTPEESRAETTCHRAQVHKPGCTGAIV
jgi:hypothetical protein